MVVLVRSMTNDSMKSPLEEHDAVTARRHNGGVEAPPAAGRVPRLEHRQGRQAAARPRVRHGGGAADAGAGPAIVVHCKLIALQISCELLDGSSDAAGSFSVWPTRVMELQCRPVMCEIQRQTAAAGHGPWVPRWNGNALNPAASLPTLPLRRGPPLAP
jgi:hypothetical protein